MTSPVSERMQIWRVVLIGAGLVVLLVAGVTALNDIPPARYPVIAAWLLGALIIHDGIIAMAVLGVSAVLLHVGRRVRFGIVLVVEAAVVVVAIFWALVVPEIIRKALGTANPSVLPLDYVVNLAVVTGVVAIITAGGAVLLARRRSGVDSAEL